MTNYLEHQFLADEISKFYWLCMEYSMGNVHVKYVCISCGFLNSPIVYHRESMKTAILIMAIIVFS